MFTSVNQQVPSWNSFTNITNSHTVKKNHHSLQHLQAPLPELHPRISFLCHHPHQRQMILHPRNHLHRHPQDQIIYKEHKTESGFESSGLHYQLAVGWIFTTHKTQLATFVAAPSIDPQILAISATIHTRNIHHHSTTINPPITIPSFNTLYQLTTNVSE